MNMTFIDELWELIQNDNPDDTENITEYLSQLETSEITAREKIITLLKFIVIKIKQKKYEEITIDLMILNLFFDGTIGTDDEFFNSLKGDETWKEDKSLNQSLDMLSIICDLNKTIKEHNEPRYWKRNFSKVKRTADQICHRPDYYYQNEIFEQNFMSSVYKEPAKELNFFIDERIVNVARYAMFVISVLTYDLEKAVEYQDSIEKILGNNDYRGLDHCLEREISFDNVEKLYKELVEEDNKKFEEAELLITQQKYIDELNERLKEVLVKCYLRSNIEVSPTVYDQKFIHTFDNIKDDVEHNAILFNKNALDVVYEKQELWVSIQENFNIKDIKKEEQLVYYLMFYSFGELEVNDTRIKMSDIKNKIDDDAHEMFEKLINYDKSSENILPLLDKYLEKIEMLRWENPLVDEPKYEYDGNILSLHDIDLVNWDINEPAYDDYACIILYTYLVGWLLTEDEKYYNGFMKAFFGNYDEPVISCDYLLLDPEIYWDDNYNSLSETPIEHSLSDLIIRICQYWKTYKPYIKYYLNEFEVDKSLIIFMEDSKSESENDVGMYNFLTWQIDDAKVELKKTGRTLSKVEYIKKTRRMSKQRAMMTGKDAFQNLKEALEPVNMLRMLIKKKVKNDHNYKAALDYLSKTFEEMVDTIYGSFYEYEDMSFVSNEMYKSLHYRTSYVFKVMASLLTATSEDDIDSLLQGKKELIPYMLQAAPDKLTEIETAIEKICSKIIDVAKNNNLINQSRKIIIEFFEKTFPKLVLPDNIFDTLATAEYLYTEYIDGKEPDNGWDYSFISILYYQVLESILNNFIYKPYIKAYTDSITMENTEEFFVKANCFNLGKTGKFFIKESIELGVMGHLLRDLDKNINLTNFLTKTYPQISVTEIPLYGKKVLEVSARRNLAAHSSKVDYENAKIDRYIVYDNDTIKFTGKLRNMVNSVLVLLFGKNTEEDITMDTDAAF